MTASGADRFRNYSDVLQRHERDMRVKKIFRVFMMFMVILILVGIIFFLWRVEQGDVPFENKKTGQRTSCAEPFYGMSLNGSSGHPPESNVQPFGDSPNKSGYEIS